VLAKSRLWTVPIVTISNPFLFIPTNEIDSTDRRRPDVIEHLDFIWTEKEQLAVAIIASGNKYARATTKMLKER
jgi:hypothetical protein